MSSPPEPPYLVRVVARCEGGDVQGFAVTQRLLAPFVTAMDPASTPSAANAPSVPRRHAPTTLPGAHPAAGVTELTYTVDLDALARRADDLDVARRFGRSLLAPASSFLLRPDPEVDGVPIRVQFEAPVETALELDGDAYFIESHELRVATFTAFGPLTARDLPLGDATVRLVVLDGALTLPVETLATWVTDAARGVADFYQRPPTQRSLVLLGPIPGVHGVPFGKLLPSSGPGVVVLVGENTKPAELRRDWVLVHELFHVGTPSYVGEGKWYDEGLATYFEPLIRARLGWISEKDVWREFLRDMPRGLEAMTERGLEHPRQYGDTYWGGALFCLLADVAVRRDSAGARGLEDGLRAVLEAGGVASEVWTLARTTEVTDAALGAPVLAGLEAAHRDHGSPLELAALFGDLGVSLGKQGQVVLDDHAPLAALRHALVYGAPR